MKELKNFQNNNEKSSEHNNTSIDKNKLQQQLHKYDGWDEDALINELMKNIARQKQDGTFDKNQIFNFVNAMGNLLTPQQKEKIENLIKIIDEQE